MRRVLLLLVVACGPDRTHNGNPGGPDGGGSNDVCAGCTTFCTQALGCVDCDPNGGNACSGSDVVACNADGSPKGPDDWTLSETFVEDDASIGSGATIMCGIRIGKGAMVGAGAVVTKDVPAWKLVVGNPARVLRDVADDELRANGG